MTNGTTDKIKYKGGSHMTTRERNVGVVLNNKKQKTYYQ